MFDKHTMHITLLYIHVYSIFFKSKTILRLTRHNRFVKLRLNKNLAKHDQE